MSAYSHLCKNSMFYPKPNFSHTSFLVMIVLKSRRLKEAIIMTIREMAIAQ